MKIPKNLRIDTKLNDRLKIYAERHKVTETSIIEEALEKYLYLKEIEIIQTWWSDKEIKPVGGVYKITNIVNGRVYIGRSTDIKQRVVSHMTSGQHTAHFEEDLKKYKRSDFIPEILEVCDPEEAKVKELHYIKKYKSYDPEFGYNRYMKL